MKWLVPKFLRFKNPKICFSDFESEISEYQKQIKEDKVCCQKLLFENKQMGMSLD